MSKLAEEKPAMPARISPVRRISAFWLIPIITLCVAALMVYENYSSQGPLITITLDSASGLEAGVTKIRTRAVEIGEVESITLNENLDRVIVSARIHKEFSNLLAVDSRFWVVEPSVSLSGISGLNTLISGQYIRFVPGNSDDKTTEFTGLDQVPLTPLGTPGLHVNLTTDSDFSFARGDSIQYQGINVGKIEDMRFDLTQGKIHYDAFIEAPFHELITSETRFWKLSGIRATLTSNGFQVETGTLDSILLGGISFTTPVGQVNLETPGILPEYYIYPNRDAIYVTQYQYALPYWIMVQDNISGLTVDSPVIFRGIQVGRILRTDFIPEGDNLLDNNFEIPLLIEINPGRLGMSDTETSLERAMSDINEWIQQGLVATIQTQNFLLGQKAVELEYNPDKSSPQLVYFNDIPVIPTDSDSIDKFTNSIEALIARLSELPLETFLADATQTAREASATMASFDELIYISQMLIEDERNAGMVSQLTSTLTEIEKLAASFSEESQITQEMQDTMKAVTELMNEFKPMVIELRNRPNSLVFPTELPVEPQPTRKQP